MESIQNFWINEVESYADPGALLILIGIFWVDLGNKADMRSEQKVSTESAQAFAKEKKMLFFETSARTAEHVVECFNTLTSNIVKDL